MTKVKPFKKFISAVIISFFLFYINTGLLAQSEDEIVNQFKKVIDGYNSGQYSSARIRLERVINIIITKKIARNDILGGCYLLLGAISEKEEKPLAAKENYRKAKNTYDVTRVYGVDLSPLPLYKEIVMGVSPSTKGIIEKEKKVKKKKFPWLIVTIGAVAAGIALYFLVIKPKKKTLKVIMDEGVEGTPVPGVYRLKKGESVNFNYHTKNGYDKINIFLDNQEYSQGTSGTFKMDKDHILSVTTTPNQVDIVTDKDSLEILENKEAILNIQLSAQPRDYVDVSVLYLSGDLDIQVLGEGVLTFTPDNWQHFQSIVFKANSDLDAENDQTTFRISAQGLQDKDINVTAIDSNSLNFTTTSDSISVDEGKTARFGVWLSARPSTVVTANVNRISGDSDIMVIGGNQLHFTPENWDIPQEVTLKAAADKDASNSTAVIRIEAPGTDVGAKEINAIEIDKEGLNFYVDTEELNIDEGANASFNVKLLAQPTVEIIADVTPISGDSDITVESGSRLTFTPSNWDNPHRVTLKAAEDDDIENSQTTIRINATGITPKYITAYENDNDYLEFVINPTKVSVVEGETASFTVKLLAQPPGDIHASAAPISGDSDITVQTGASLIFTPETWDTEQSITLAAAKDEDEEKGETVIAISASDVATATITADEIDNFRGDPPEISIFSPETGETVDQDITIKAIAGDDFGIKRVDFYIDGIFKESDFSLPYRYDLPIKDISTGSHKIKAIAYDSIEQSAEDEITISVIDGLPTVAIKVPDTTPLIGEITVDIHAQDFLGVELIRLYIDDILLTTWEQGPQNQVDFAYVLDTVNYSNGSHMLKAVAIDTSYQESEPSEVKIIIENF